MRSPKSPPGHPVPDVTLEAPRGTVCNTPVTLSNPAVDVIPDSTYPNMWRVRFRDGPLSDMVNLARAKDALRALREDARNRGPPRS